MLTEMCRRQQLPAVATIWMLVMSLTENYVHAHQILTQTIQDMNSQGIELEPEVEGRISNVTFPAGREAVLTCSVKNLGRYKVAWLRATDQTVLALQDLVVTHNNRISVSHEGMHTWRLRIKQIRESDKGCYMCQINSSPMKKEIGCIDVQVPPDIINEESSTDIAVQEQEDTVLTCRATGNPTPRVTWRREDGENIILRRPGNREVIKVESYNGTSLRLLKLERRQMGAYLCIASNDVPPAVSKRVSLSVHFAPSVQVPSQLLGAPLGSEVQLQCLVEASPGPVFYWLKGGKSPTNLEAGQPKSEMLLDGPTYSITEQRVGYRSVMRLVIRKFSKSDIGTYHCVSSNSLGKAEQTLRLYEIKMASGSISSQEDHPNFIGGLAEAALGRGNSRGNLVRSFTSNSVLFLLTAISLWLTSTMRS